MSEDQLRQRKGQKEKEAMRSKLEEMRRKMKDTEERQERVRLLHERQAREVDQFDEESTRLGFR